MPTKIKKFKHLLTIIKHSFTPYSASKDLKQKQKQKNSCHYIIRPGGGAVRQAQVLS